MKYRKLTTTLTALAAAMTLSLTATAGGDKDKDMHELSQEQKDLLTQLDANQDGVISEQEALRHPELAERFRQLDRNGDQILERAEFARFEVDETEGENPDYPDYPEDTP